MSNTTKIRVGFIGLNPGSHWAATAHLPALKSLSAAYEIVGVANSTPESAERTAKALGLPYAFKSYKELVASDKVDLVVVTVKVPHHFELVSAALNAGKHVYCEWPLGNGLNEAKKLATLAEEKGVVAVVGTQMKYAPEISFLKQLIADGYVGQVLSTTLVGTGGNWGNTTIEEYYYLFDKANGATMLEIPFMHTIAGLTEVLGNIKSSSTTLFSNFQEVAITETNEIKPKTAADQIMLHGRLESGAAIVAHYRGGVNKATNLLWEINGTEGDLQITADSGHGQMAALTIKGAKSNEDGKLEVIEIPSDRLKDWPKFPGARNVGHIYKLLAEDIRIGSKKAPSFKYGVELHELINTIQNSEK